MTKAVNSEIRTEADNLTDTTWPGWDPKARSLRLVDPDGLEPER